jgi:hypothetical protein
MRVAIFGNCQAGLIETWLKASSPGLQVVSAPLSFTVKDDQEADIYRIFDSCDFIFAQRIADENPRAFMRTRVLKARYGDRVISWPNAYFDGYFPGLRYIRNSQGIHAVGPLNDYHFDFVANAYMTGVPIETCVAIMEGDGIFEKHPDPIEKSLGQLIAREQGLDVCISDFIRANLATRLFYSMNHPSNHVIHELTRRMLNKAGLGAHMPRNEPPWAFDKIVIGMFPSICRRFGLKDHLPRFEFLGMGVVAENGTVKNAPNSVQVYTPRELVESYYRVYRELGITAKDSLVVYM